MDGTPAIRVALRGRDHPGTDPTVFGRWLDEILLPAGFTLSTATEARQDALAFFRTGRTMQTSPLEAGGGRLVGIDEVRSAAQALDDENILPWSLPGDLNLTEAFLAFSLLLADQAEGEVIRLGALQGPRTHAQSRGLGIQDLECDAAASLARALLAELPVSIPAALPVGGQLYSAPEVLTLLASAVRGDTPCQTWPTASPDPNAPGQGWGESTLP